MLYITFKILDASKFNDFQKIYDHMVMVRQPNFKFEDNGPEIDWDAKKTQEEVDGALEELNYYLDNDPEVIRYNEIIPDYVTSFLEQYIDAYNEKLNLLGIQEVQSIFNYLEHGFEVDLNSLETTSSDCGIVKFSTANFPFGGIERFLITLKAYDILPLECYDGFSICKIVWNTDISFDFITLDAKTEAYKKNKAIK